MQGYHVPLKECDGLGACYRPGGLLTTRMQPTVILLPPLPFGSSVPTTFTCSTSRSLVQVQIPSPYRLPSAYPDVVSRRAFLLRFKPHMLPCFASLSGSLFIQTPRFTQWYRWFTMFPCLQLLFVASCRKSGLSGL